MGVKGESGFRPISMAFAARSHRNFQRTVIINASSALARGALPGSRPHPCFSARSLLKTAAGSNAALLRITAPRRVQLTPVVASNCALWYAPKAAPAAHEAGAQELMIVRQALVEKAVDFSGVR